MHWCILSLVVVTIVAVVVRWLARKVTSNKTVITHVDEFVGNVGTAVFMMELGVVASMYGTYSTISFIGNFIHLYLKIVYFSSLGLYANPFAFIESFYNNNRHVTFSLAFAFTIIVTQIAGLIVGQELSKWVWMLEDEVHVEAMREVCRTSLSPEYTVLYAAMLEGVGTLIGGILDHVTPPKYQAAEGAFIVTSLFFMFGHVNGMYMNPSLATGFSFRCEGHSGDWDHLLVYWLVPGLFMVLAREICWHVGKLNASASKVSDGKMD